MNNIFYLKYFVPKLIVALFLLAHAFIVNGAVTLADGLAERPICLYHMSAKVNSPSQENLSGGDILLDDGTVLCDSPSDYCFSFWQILPQNGTDVVDTGTIGPSNPGFSWLARGCFKNVYSCNRESCVATEKEAENSYFCCCKGHRCNEKIDFEEATHTPVASDPPVDGFTLDPLSKSLYVIAGSLVLVAVSVTSVICYKMHRGHKTLPNTSLGLSNRTTSPCIDLNNLKFLEVLGQGRYGTVFRGMLGDEEVAVKLFYPNQRFSFSNEKYIYSLPLMEHSNLLSYLGGGEIIGPDNNPYLGLVLSYCSKGSLSSFLRENTLDWTSFCRVVHSTVKGLAHLHSEMNKGDLIKPCVCHRDFNTRNILLKEDMSCAVSDLGFAIHTQGAKFYVDGEEQIAEMASLTDVGTLRYMAPEVLEGAVNLRDCETSLKQIDIYALGLVLWEVAYRCHDLYQGAPTPDYALPFQAEKGLHPTFEEMQVLVVRNKARPLFPQIWKDTCPAIKQLKETIEDSWDNDADARLSAMCVERRLAELPKLWSRYKNSLALNGISPTSNPPSSGMGVGRYSGDSGSWMINNVLGVSSSSEKDYSTHWAPGRESSASETTAETTLPISPSDPPPIGKNHMMEAFKCNPLPCLQPHQGRNPCLERNTINDLHSDGSSSSGNFLEASSKYAASNGQGRVNFNNFFVDRDLFPSGDSQTGEDNHMPLLHHSSHVGANLSPITRSIPLQYPPPVPPIPYLQNETRAGEGRPKLQNAAVDHQRRRGLWRKVVGDILLPMFSRRRPRNETTEEERNILVQPPNSALSEPPTPMFPFEQPKDHFNLPQESKVVLSNGEHFTVISNRAGVTNDIASALPRNLLKDSSSNSQHFSPGVNLPPITEIGIGKLQMASEIGSVARSKRESKDSGINKSNENSSSYLESDSSLDRLKRPVTLSLLANDVSGSDVSHPTDQSLEALHNEKTTSVVLRKPKKRIKTPLYPVAARLSFCSDDLNTNLFSELGHAQSLPDDIDVTESQIPQRAGHDKHRLRSSHTDCCQGEGEGCHGVGTDLPHPENDAKTLSVNENFLLQV